MNSIDVIISAILVLIDLAVCIIIGIRTKGSAALQKQDFVIFRNVH